MSRRCSISWAKPRALHSRRMKTRPAGNMVKALASYRSETDTVVSKLGERSRGNRSGGNRPERFREVLGSLKAPLRGPPITSENTPCIGELVTCTSQRSPGAVSETLSEPLSERHFPLRVAGLVAPTRVAP